MTDMTKAEWDIARLPGRWIQLILGLIAMMAISSPQYVWTLFRKPLQGVLATDLATIQVTFSVLVVLQTLFSPVQGYLTEKFGPRLLVSVGALLTGAGWILSSQVDSVPLLYLTYGGMGGIGTGIIYVGVVGLMVKWFPKQRGFATGCVAAGYGFGAMLTSFPISDMIDSSGYQQTLIVFGAGIALVGLLAAQGLREPPSPVLSAGDSEPLAATGYDWRQMLKTPIFWLMFGMMTMMSTGGLMVISPYPRPWSSAPRHCLWRSRSTV